MPEHRNEGLLKLQRRKIEREANEASIALAWVVKNAGAIEERANADSYDGFGAGGSDGRRSGVSDPTSAQGLRYVLKPGVTRLPDELDRRRQTELAVGQFKDALYEALQAAKRAENLGRSMLAIDPKEARKLAKETPDASGICANPACKVTVLNLPNDRLREGRCENCYRFRKEHWGNERPRDLCHPVEVVG